MRCLQPLCVLTRQSGRRIFEFCCSPIPNFIGAPSRGFLIWALGLYNLGFDPVSAVSVPPFAPGWVSALLDGGSRWSCPICVRTRQTRTAVRAGFPPQCWGTRLESSCEQVLVNRRRGSATPTVCSTLVALPCTSVLFRPTTHGSHLTRGASISTGSPGSVEASAIDGCRFPCLSTSTSHSAASSGGATFLQACKRHHGTQACTAPRWKRLPLYGSVSCEASTSWRVRPPMGKFRVIPATGREFAGSTCASPAAILALNAQTIISNMPYTSSTE